MLSRYLDCWQAHVEVWMTMYIVYWRAIRFYPFCCVCKVSNKSAWPLESHIVWGLRFSCPWGIRNTLYVPRQFWANLSGNLCYAVNLSSVSPGRKQKAGPQARTGVVVAVECFDTSGDRRWCDATFAPVKCHFWVFDSPLYFYLMPFYSEFIWLMYFSLRNSGWHFRNGNFWCSVSLFDKNTLAGDFWDLPSSSGWKKKSCNTSYSGEFQ